MFTKSSDEEVICSRYSRNSETNDSDSEENTEKRFPRYYIHDDVFSVIKSLTTQYCATRRENTDADSNLTLHYTMLPVWKELSYSLLLQTDP